MKERLSVYLDPHVMRSTSIMPIAEASKSLVAEAAIASFLSPDAAERRKRRLRDLDRLARQMERLERDVGITVETLALFVRFWLRRRRHCRSKPRRPPEPRRTLPRHRGARSATFQGPTLLREVSVDMAAHLSPPRAQSPSTALEILTAIGGVRHSPVFLRQRATTLCSLLRSHAWPFLFILDIGPRGDAVVGDGPGHLHSGRKRSHAARDAAHGAGPAIAAWPEDPGVVEVMLNRRPPMGRSSDRRADRYGRRSTAVDGERVVRLVARWCGSAFGSSTCFRRAAGKR